MNEAYVIPYARTPEAPVGREHQPIWHVLYVSLGTSATLLALCGIAFLARGLEMPYRERWGSVAGAVAFVVLLNTGFALLAFTELVLACFCPVARVRGICNELLILAVVLMNYPLAYLAWVIGVSQ